MWDKLLFDTASVMLQILGAGVALAIVAFLWLSLADWAKEIWREWQR